MASLTARSLVLRLVSGGGPLRRVACVRRACAQPHGRCVAVRRAVALSAHRSLSSAIVGVAPAAAAAPEAPVGGVRGPTIQQAVQRLQDFWASVGCAIYLPHNTEVRGRRASPPLRTCCARRAIARCG